MILFLLGLAILVLGYFFYGKIVERIFMPDDRQTPAHSCADGVDFLVLPSWKNMLIQLLNIAGVGPVIGVILGIKFGPIVFLILPIGNIIGGAVHDYFSGMISIRKHGANLPALITENLGKVFGSFMSIFMIVLLLLVVAVFINIPANLINEMVPSAEIWLWAILGIFAYYICATLFSVDKIIGTIYPYFGAILILSSLIIFVMVMIEGMQNPELMQASEHFKSFDQPVIPVLFVTIACGIISGFHATQSPIVARTIHSEKEGYQVFYGMMVVEGVIAMIWAATGMVIYNIFPVLFNEKAPLVLSEAAKYFLGSYVGTFAIVGVILLAITSGDTAMRSLRLLLAEMMHLSQVSVKNRLIITFPIIFIVTLLLFWSNQSAKTFNELWNYFSWGNQVLAASTLMAISVWLFKRSRWGWISLIPGAFMTFIVFFYILWVSPSKEGPVGFGLEYNLAFCISAILALACSLFIYFRFAHKKIHE